MIIPVILAGGSGTRLWPISRPEFPKQFAPILGCKEYTLFQKAILRSQKIPNSKSPIIICNHQHLSYVNEQLAQLSIFDAKIIVEPVGRNTAPAIACAAMFAQTFAADPTLLVLPADHVIGDEDQFIAAVSTAYSYAQQGRLLCFGIVPQRPETGYGYIKVGDQLLSGNAYAVEKFVEKPHQELAIKYFNSDGYLWNGGIFMFRAMSFLQELKQYAADIFAACEATIQTSKIMDNILQLAANEFILCRSDSIDYAVMEHTQNAAVVPLDAKWSDVGSWAALWEQLDKDTANNVLVGDVIAENSHNSYIHASKRKIVAIGMKDHVIIETDDLVLVTPKEQAQDLCQIIAKINAEKT